MSSQDKYLDITVTWRIFITHNCFGFKVKKEVKNYDSVPMPRGDCRYMSLEGTHTCVQGGDLNGIVPRTG